MGSYILAVIFLILFLVMAYLIWVYGHKHGYESGWTGKGVNRLTAFIVIFGIIFSAYAFIVDHRMRISTLYEDFIEGSTGLQIGSAAPVREVTFNVEHSGIEHELFISPASGFGRAASYDVTILIRLEDKDKNVIIDAKEVFKVRGATRRSKADWYSKTYRFTPDYIGPYKLTITPLTVGIPKVHVRITDPMKKDGKRPPGY